MCLKTSWAKIQWGFLSVSNMNHYTPNFDMLGMMWGMGVVKVQVTFPKNLLARAVTKACFRSIGGQVSLLYWFLHSFIGGAISLRINPSALEGGVMWVIDSGCRGGRPHRHHPSSASILLLLPLSPAFVHPFHSSFFDQSRRWTMPMDFQDQGFWRRRGHQTVRWWFALLGGLWFCNSRTILSKVTRTSGTSMSSDKLPSVTTNDPVAQDLIHFPKVWISTKMYEIRQHVQAWESAFPGRRRWRRRGRGGLNNAFQFDQSGIDGIKELRYCILY